MEEVKAEGVVVVQAQPVEEEPMTYGIPDRVWLENDIDPAILEDLPEETRNDIIAGMDWEPPVQ